MAQPDDVASSALASLSLKQPADHFASWVPPAAWLQLLVNDKQCLGARQLSSLMAASWDMCEAVLRVMDKWRLLLEVRARAGRHGCTCSGVAPYNQAA
jgi:hypothetical protein